MAVCYSCDICQKETYEECVLTDDKWSQVTIEPILCQAKISGRLYHLCPSCRYWLIQELEIKRAKARKATEGQDDR